MEIDLGIDAYSVFAAVTATQVKAPAEKALLSHVQYLRELLDRGVCKSLIWFDTRDMLADGLTKGAVERAALLALMDGNFQVMHKCERWSSKLQTSKSSQAHVQGSDLTTSVDSYLCVPLSDQQGKARLVNHMVPKSIFHTFHLSLIHI